MICNPITNIFCFSNVDQFVQDHFVPRLIVSADVDQIYPRPCGNASLIFFTPVALELQINRFSHALFLLSRNPDRPLSLFAQGGCSRFLSVAFQTQSRPRPAAPGIQSASPSHYHLPQRAIATMLRCGPFLGSCILFYHSYRERSMALQRQEPPLLYCESGRRSGFRDAIASLPHPLVLYFCGEHEGLLLLICIPYFLRYARPGRRRS